MDPVFNDTSTYERSLYNQELSQTHNVGWSHGDQDETDARHDQNQDSGSFHPGSQVDHAMHNDMTAPNFFPASTPSQMASSSLGNMSPGLTLSSNPSNSHAPQVVPVSQGFADASELDHAAVGQELPNCLDDERGTTGASGVDFQNLLGNLAAAPSASATEPAPSLAEDSSLHQAPTGESSHAQGIPLRFLPQDSSPAHPDYASAEDPHAYHQLPTNNNSASSYATQPSKQPHQHLSPHLASVGPSGTVSGTGTLLPPPITGFQHASSASTESQPSSQEHAAPGPLKKGRLDKQPGRPGKGTDDDAPWGPEVQKKYDAFLQEERIYVTEGLWDRFPVGSRLFVGQCLPLHPSGVQQSNQCLSAQETSPPNE